MSGTLIYDKISAESRRNILEYCSDLNAALSRCTGDGVNGYHPEDAELIDTIAYACDKLIRKLGWKDETFTQDEIIQPSNIIEVPKRYIWELFGYTSTTTDSSSTLTGGTSGNNSGTNSGSTGTDGATDPNSGSDGTGSNGSGQFPGEGEDPDSDYPPDATPETPSPTVWYKVGAYQRCDLREAAALVLDTIRTSQMGGVQAGEHVKETRTIYNNPRNVDWAVWHLLIALAYAGYHRGPMQ